MKTLAEIYEGNASDKGSVHSYIELYEKLLRGYREVEGNVLEIGVFGGDSILMWEEYFTRAKVWGMDLCEQPLNVKDLRPMIEVGTHNLVFGDASNPEDVAGLFGDMVFGVIIDDGCHVLEVQLKTYEVFRHLLAPGGIYIIEDIQDIDANRGAFEQIDARRNVSIIDNRPIKARYDDVLVVIHDAL